MGSFRVGGIDAAVTYMLQHSSGLTGDLIPVRASPSLLGALGEAPHLASLTCCTCKPGACIEATSGPLCRSDE